MPSQGVTNVANAIINKINNRISSHNSDENAHQDIREKIPSCGTFTELQTIINNAQNDDTIILDRDYKNSGEEDYPRINKVIKIIGNGHVIDGNNVDRIFNAGVDGITFENIVFINGSNNALYGRKMNIFDCIFVNNFEYYDGGAVLAEYGANIINSIFINNKVEADDWKSRGGAICIGGSNSLIQDCLFIGNSARATGYDGLGGAIFLDGENNQTKIQNCLFIDNSAKTGGGGIYSSTQDFKTYNCIFTNSTLYNTTNVDYLTENAAHTHSDADITTFGFYSNLPQANVAGPSQQLVNSAINSAMGGKEDNANKVTSLSSSSTDTQYPSAKAVYDATFNLDTLDCINENFTILSLPQIIFTYNEGSFDGSRINILNTYTEEAYVSWDDGTPLETYESTDTLEHSYSDNVQEHTITIYGNIPNLYNNSFKNLTGITNINIPSSVTSLGKSCFNGCTGLTNVTIPNGVTSLGDDCFFNCAGLTSITIPSSVTSIGSNCFYGCSGLTSVAIPSGVTSLSDYCFLNCTGLTSIAIPSSVTSLGIQCFYGCSGLTSVAIPSGVTSLSSYCFEKCSGLTNITIPSSVTSLGKNCFKGCTGLTNITIPSGVTSLGINCFNGCAGLTSITIPSGVTSLGNYCFAGCSGLTSVTIPSSVTSLGTYCFRNCTNLVDYQLYWETPPVTWSSTLMPNNTDTYFTIPNGTTTNYTAQGFPSEKLVERSE